MRTNIANTQNRPPVLSSAEGRGHIKSLFTKEDGTPVAIRYVDKKRIQSWLNVNRLQLPLHNLDLNSNNIIDESAKKVNTKLSLSDDVGENVPAGGISGKDVKLQEKSDTAKETPQYTEGEKKLFAIVDAIRNGTDPKAAIEAVTAEQLVDIHTVKERNDAKRQNNAGVEIKLIKELAE